MYVGLDGYITKMNLKEIRRDDTNFREVYFLAFLYMVTNLRELHKTRRISCNREIIWLFKKTCALWYYFFVPKMGFRIHLSYQYENINLCLLLFFLLR